MAASSLGLANRSCAMLYQRWSRGHGFSWPLNRGPVFTRHMRKQAGSLRRMVKSCGWSCHFRLASQGHFSPSPIVFLPPSYSSPFLRRTGTKTIILQEGKVRQRRNLSPCNAARLEKIGNRASVLSVRISIFVTRRPKRNESRSLETRNRARLLTIARRSRDSRF